MNIKKIYFILLFAVLINIAFASSAYAYMDPGTGSLIFQIIIASAIGALFVVRRSWKKIVGYFKQLFKGTDKT